MTYVLQVAGFFSVIWGMSLLSYLFSSYMHIPVFANPLCLVGFCILYLINPIHILHYKARMWLLRVLVSTLNSRWKKNNLNQSVHSFTI